MSTNELISVIIPVKNEAKRIKTIVDGLYRQTYRPIEVIFVDGGSTDGTIELIQEAVNKYSRDGFRVRLLKESDFGMLRSPANARNIGVANAGAQYVCFFDADYDLSSDPEAISKIMDAFMNGAEHVIIRYVPNEHTWIERNLALDDIIYYFNGDKPRHEVSCFLRELLLKNPFDPTLGFREDLELLGRLTRLGIKSTIVDTSIRRCYPHTVKDVIKQQLWYGRTWIKYERKVGDNWVIKLIRSNAVIGLLILIALAASLKIITLSLVILLLMLSLIYYRWLRRDIHYAHQEGDISVVNRFAWILFREVLGRLIFDLGVFQALLRRSRISIGR